MSTLQPAATPESVTPTTLAPADQDQKPKKSASGDAAGALHVALGLARRGAHRRPVDDPHPRPARHVVPHASGTSTAAAGGRRSTDPGGFTLENYRQALEPGSSASLSQYFINTIVITVPAVLLPIFLASLAAYAFAWMPFPGRDALFVAVFALQIVPLQIALIPLLDIYANKLGLRGVVLERVAVAHDLRAATGDVPHPQLHARAAGRAHGGGTGRRRGARDDLLQDPPAPAHPGPRGVRDLPVPLGLERPARVVGLPRWDARRRADHRARGRARPGPEAVPGTSCRRVRSSR